MSRLASIFISYSHADKALAQVLATELEERGLRVWIDEGELKIGDSLIERIASRSEGGRYHREREDVEAAAAPARAGEPLGAPSRALTKAREVLLLKQRDLNALRLAQEQAEQDLVRAIGEHADAWGVSLRDAAEKARETGQARSLGPPPGVSR